MSKRTTAELWTTVVLALMATACVSTTQGGRSQLLLFPPADLLVKNTNVLHEKTIRDATQGHTLNPDAQQLARFQQIMKRLIPPTTVFRSDAVNWEWEVNVIDNPLIENVGVLPGGKIVFYTGFFIKEPPLPPLTDDEIAVLMGHEIAHALREHARERGSHELLKVLVVGLSSCLVGLRTGLSTTALKDTGNLIADLGFTRPYSRLHETEADEIGIELAARAGYDPRAAIQFWQTMSIHRSDDQRPQWLSTHPSHATRLKDLESYSIRLLPLYEQAKIKQLEETKPTQQLEETKPTQTRQKPGKGSPSRRPKK